MNDAFVVVLHIVAECFRHEVAAQRIALQREVILAPQLEREVAEDMATEWLMNQFYRAAALRHVARKARFIASTSLNRGVIGQSSGVDCQDRSASQ